jgi:hypothetical protein
MPDGDPLQCIRRLHGRGKKMSVAALEREAVGERREICDEVYDGWVD